MSLVNGRWSLFDLVTRIEKELLLLPAFQRGYVWTLDRERELFDSLIRSIPTGSITLATPSFPMAVAKVDTRDGADRGATQAFEPKEISDFEAKTVEAQKELGTSFKCLLVLDGQQRITSIYRVLKKIDHLYLSFPATTTEIKNFSQLAGSVREVAVDEDEESLCVEIADAYGSRNSSDIELAERFSETRYGRHLNESADEETKKREEGRYQRLVKDVGEVLRNEQCVNFIESSAAEEELLLFFERSNTKGEPLSFQDLLNARTFKAFQESNLGSFSQALKKLSSLPQQYQIRNIEDNFIRIRCYEPLLNVVKKGDNPLSKTVILKSIDGNKIVKKFDYFVNSWPKPLDFLFKNRLATARDEMPFPLMVIPTFFFLKEVDFNVSKLGKAQLDFFYWWYWASVFSRRYSFQTNEAAYSDIKLLQAVAAKRVDLVPPTIVSEMKLGLTSREDVALLRGKSGHFQRAISALSVYKFDAKCVFSGLSLAAIDGQVGRKGKGKKKLAKLDYHHIFPVTYLSSCGYKGVYRDSISNLMYATERQRGGLSSAPSDYLANETEFPEGMKTHYVSEEMYEKLVSGSYDDNFESFVLDRADQMVAVITAVAGENQGKKVIAALQGA
jgi:hypothetical protein